MLGNYLKVTFRNLFRHKFYTLLNILGLSLGIACAMLIVNYIQHERSYDLFHENAERIYRLNARYEIGNRVDQYANVPRPLGPTLAKDYPEVLEFARVVKHNRYTGNKVLIRNAEDKERAVEEDLVFAADSSYFKIFSHHFLAGDPVTALNAPNAAVITRSIAQKVFGTTDVLNREITIDNSAAFRISGIIEDVPETTHLPFTVLLSWQTFHSERDLQRWIGGHVYTYLLFPPEHDTDAFMAKFPAFYEKYMAATFQQFNGTFDLMIQPLPAIHLHSHLQWEAAENGNILYVYIFGAVGLFILLIACINYMNLATARAAARMDEVGMRKVLGADRQALIRQFFGESLLMAFLSFLVALLLVLFFQPAVNSLAGKTLSGNVLNWQTISALLLIALTAGLISGIYPALYLSGFQPIRLLKKQGQATKAALRKALVVVQFAISIIIIIATATVHDQLNYSREKELGFNRENILVLTVRDNEMEKQLAAIKAELLQHPNILKAATSPDLPGKDLNHTAMQIETPGGSMEDQTVQFMFVDHDYLDLMEMQLIAGRNFDRSRVSDPERAIIINQTLAKKFQWDNPVGKRVHFAGDTTDIFVVGVVNDFHIGSLHHEIAPVVIALSEQERGKLYLRIRNDDLANTLAFVKEKWASFDANFPLDYLFLDENYFKLYEADEKLATIFQYCAIIAIFISCLGLLGLSAYTTAHRTKEIGVRKVLGATISNIVILLSKDYIKLVLFANVLAWPVAFYVMNYWLEGFAYRTELDWAIFLLAAVAAALIALVTISFLSIKAALINPADSLRYE